MESGPGEGGAPPVDSDGAAIFERRKAFTRLTERDVVLLRGLHDVFQRHADEIVDAFYEHLLAFDELRPLLADPSTVKRLKGSQRAYLISLTSGSYDAVYAEGRRAIGRMHDRIGLEPQWYLGTYGLYIDLLMPHVHAHYRSHPGRATRAGVALTKLLILDMQLVLDAYHETRQRRLIGRNEQLAAVGELAASIAHEVRNPLAGMKGALELLRRELTAKPGSLEVVDEVLAQIDRLSNLVRDLLSYARPRPLIRSEFDLHEMLDRLVRYLEDQAETASVTVQRIYGPGTARLHADPALLEQVFSNLLQNAMQAMDEGGTLTVSTRLDGRNSVISFEDTGRGIAPDVLTQIFQPFFTTKHRGSGLGLSIVRKILDQHGARIDVQSRPGQGTVARVVLPLREER